MQSTLNGQNASYYLDYNNFTNKPSLNFLPLTGGTLTGTLAINRVSMKFIAPTDAESGWARGVGWYDAKQEKMFGMIGAHGTGDTFENLFFGLNESPWRGLNALTITPGDIKFNNISLARSNGTYSNMTVGKATTATTATTADTSTMESLLQMVRRHRLQQQTHQQRRTMFLLCILEVVVD